MKTKIFLCVALLANAGGQAMAACSGTQIVNTTGITETAAITFGTPPNNNQTVTVAGAAITATQGNVTAAQVAAAFANLAAGSLPNAGGNYSRSGTLTGWTSSGVTGTSTVTFTSTTPNSNVTNIATSTTGVVATLTASTANGSSANNALTTLLTGNTVCVGSSPTWAAQEYHQSGGALIDYKRGPGHPVDPTGQVGTWSVTGTGTATKVNYTYGSTTYANSVWSNGGNSYSFCNPSETIGTVKTGQGACP